MNTEYHQFFISNEQSISNDVKQQIALLRHASVDVLTIYAILKKKFDDCVTWVYNDIYNFIYQLEGTGSEKKEFDAEESKYYGHNICFAGMLIIDKTEDNFIWVFTKFLEMVNQHALLIIFIDDDCAMANA
ncbi:protein FAR1-RELATED SEQUENCE 5-like [Rhizophagus irregularis DAOM 181602=DAOM 197198]|nr:protein FAR1-RELATED SEQUENCE 5-like [Rhizophagus irregularis DAOM 181602=DAOM 197198]